MWLNDCQLTSININQHQSTSINVNFHFYVVMFMIMIMFMIQSLSLEFHHGINGGQSWNKWWTILYPEIWCWWSRWAMRWRDKTTRWRTGEHGAFPKQWGVPSTKMVVSWESHEISRFFFHGLLQLMGEMIAILGWIVGHFTTPNSVWGVGSPACHGLTWVLSWKTSRNKGSNQPEIWVVTN